MDTYELPPITLSKKRQLIDAAGFRFNPECGVYVNRRLRKAFSWQFLDAHDADDVSACLRRPPTVEWQFYFNDPPPPSVREQLEEALS